MLKYNSPHWWLQEGKDSVSYKGQATVSLIMLQ